MRLGVRFLGGGLLRIIVRLGRAACVGRRPVKKRRLALLSICLVDWVQPAQCQVNQGSTPVDAPGSHTTTALRVICGCGTTIATGCGSRPPQCRVQGATDSREGERALDVGEAQAAAAQAAGGAHRRPCRHAARPAARPQVLQQGTNGRADQRTSTQTAAFLLQSLGGSGIGCKGSPSVRLRPP